jgi:hypothetical protein
VTASRSLVGIYRARNADLVRRIVQPALDEGWSVVWWALDEIVEDLADITAGRGAGAKLPLVNEILRVSGRSEWLVVSDDDVAFDRGDVIELVSLCERAELDLAQPARSDAAVDHGITAARRLSLARRTSFVEIGPVFAVGPDWRDRIVPFPEERGMGWGLELEWHELFREGCALGIVDAVRVRHEGSLGEHYDYRTQVHRVHEELETRGFRGWSDAQLTLCTWRPWQRTPAWVRTRSAE